MIETAEQIAARKYEGQYTDVDRNTEKCAARVLSRGISSYANQGNSFIGIMRQCKNKNGYGVSKLFCKLHEDGEK